ncbi:CsbD family protein [Streptomyces sp. NPDC051597]|uniref:CsbD family protein n=1 Tax=Streptomyces sp. NPDC051597 TaxID=3155049 RepID=UPI003443941D
MAGKGKMGQVKGKAKEAAGKVTGNDSMKAEGRMDQAKGKAGEARSDIEDRARKAGQQMPGAKK